MHGDKFQSQIHVIESHALAKLGCVAMHIFIIWISCKASKSIFVKPKTSNVHVSTNIQNVFWRNFIVSHTHTCTHHKQWKSVVCHRHQINNYIDGPCNLSTPRIWLLTEHRLEIFMWGCLLCSCFLPPALVIPYN